MTTVIFRQHHSTRACRDSSPSFTRSPEGDLVITLTEGDDGAVVTLTPADLTKISATQEGGAE